MKKLFILLLVTFFILTCTHGFSAHKNPVITVKILYDNYIHTDGTKSDWGFSCLIKGTEKNILFDTGTKGKILFFNIKKLNVDIKDIELVMISHYHLDHYGGLLPFLEKNHRVSVYLPFSFPHDFIKKVEQKKVKVITVNKPVKICKNVFSTGQMGDKIIEQSLILDTHKGLILITGCSHPGIVNIVKRAKEIINKKVYMVFGGFHLMRKSEKELNEIISQFKKLGVLKVGATHCTGDNAIKFLKKAYGKNFIEMGVGKVLKF